MFTLKHRTPSEVGRTFANNELRQHGIKPIHLTQKIKNYQGRPKMKTNWGRTRLNYGFLNRCKELICRVPHPSRLMQHKGAEYRLSVLPWSRGSYIDLRMFYTRPDGTATSTGMGILLHLDVVSALLPELVATVRRLEMEDTRDEKAHVTVLPA